VKNMAIKTSANNKIYGDYILADRTGEVNAKLWEVADPAACPDVGAFLKVQGLVTEWQGKLQLRIDRFGRWARRIRSALATWSRPRPRRPGDARRDLAICEKYRERPHSGHRRSNG
jgi:hypothetical protein